MPEATIKAKLLLDTTGSSLGSSVSSGSDSISKKKQDDANDVITGYLKPALAKDLASGGGFLAKIGLGGAAAGAIGTAATAVAGAVGLVGAGVAGFVGGKTVDQALDEKDRIDAVIKQTDLQKEHLETLGATDDELQQLDGTMETFNTVHDKVLSRVRAEVYETGNLNDQTTDLDKNLKNTESSAGSFSSSVNSAKQEIIDFGNELQVTISRLENMARLRGQDPYAAMNFIRSENPYEPISSNPKSIMSKYVSGAGISNLTKEQQQQKAYEEFKRLAGNRADAEEIANMLSQDQTGD